MGRLSVRGDVPCEGDGHGGGWEEEWGFGDGGGSVKPKKVAYELIAHKPLFKTLILGKLGKEIIVKRMLFLLSVVGLLAFVVAGCGGVGADGSEDGGSTPKNYSFVGEWYQVGSINDSGFKVVFTETTIVAYFYNIGWDRDWFLYDGRYLLSDDTLKILSKDTLEYRPLLETPFEFHSSDTLKLKHFIPSIAADAIHPAAPINLFRRKDYES